MKHLLLTTIAAAVLTTTAFADPIHDAVARGDLAGVQAELDKGVDVNAKTNWGDGGTPLHWAAYEGRKEVVELLVAKGADVNTKEEEGYMPLDFAIISENTEIADLLLEHGGKSGANDSIQVAASVGNIEAVKRHLAAGADVNAKDVDGLTPLFFAVYYDHNEIVELLIAHGADVDTEEEAFFLSNATWGGYTEIVERLIANGADVNAKDYFGSTPLHSAVSEGHKEIAKLLVAAGADVNVKGGWGGDTPLDWAEEGWESDSPEIKAAKKEIALLLREHGGKTTAELGVLIDAAKNGDFEAIKQAIADGVDVNVKGGWGELTPLHGAAGGGHKEIVELLIVNGADVNAKDESGLTPLHSAVGSSRLVVEMLIAAGADVNAKIDPFGDTPLDWAEGHPETADLLREHGGKTGEELPPATLF